MHAGLSCSWPAAELDGSSHARVGRRVASRRENLHTETPLTYALIITPRRPSSSSLWPSSGCLSRQLGLAAALESMGNPFEVLAGPASAAVRVDETEERNTEQQGFTALAGDAVLQVSGPFPAGYPQERVQLLSVACGKYLYATAANDICLGEVADLSRALVEVPSKKASDVFSPSVRFTVEAPISHVAFSHDAAKFYVAAAQGGLLVYETLTAQGARKEIQVPPVSDLLPNPADESLALLTTDGQLFLLKDGELKNIAQNVTSMSWSKKGKQIVAGTRDGGLQQFSPDGTLKDTLDPVGNEISKVNAINWLENNLFVVSLENQENEISVYMLRRSSANGQKSITYTLLANPSLSFGDTSHPPKYSFVVVSKSLVLTASTTSADLGLISIPHNAALSIDDDVKKATLRFSPERDTEVSLTGLTIQHDRDQNKVVIWYTDNDGGCGAWNILDSENNLFDEVQSAGAVAASVQATVSPFASAQAIAAVPTSSPASAFGSTSFPSSPFQQAQSNNPAPMFGSSAFASSNAHNSPFTQTQGDKPAPMFGGSAFEGSTVNSSPFAQTQTEKPAPMFGNSAFGTPAAGASPFGSSSAFSTAQPTSAFGNTAQFGKPAAFGSSSFGSSAQMANLAPFTGFGSTSAFSNTDAKGFGGFGATATKPVTKSAFGTKPRFADADASDDDAMHEEDAINNDDLEPKESSLDNPFSGSAFGIGSKAVQSPKHNVFAAYAASKDAASTAPAPAAQVPSTNQQNTSVFGSFNFPEPKAQANSIFGEVTSSNSPSQSSTFGSFAKFPGAKPGGFGFAETSQPTTKLSFDPLSESETKEPNPSVQVKTIEGNDSSSSQTSQIPKPASNTSKLSFGFGNPSTTSSSSSGFNFASGSSFGFSKPDDTTNISRAESNHSDQAKDEPVVPESAPLPPDPADTADKGNLDSPDPASTSSALNTTISPVAEDAPLPPDPSDTYDVKAVKADTDEEEASTSLPTGNPAVVLHQAATESSTHEALNESLGSNTTKAAATPVHEESAGAENLDNSYVEVAHSEDSEPGHDDKTNQTVRTSLETFTTFSDDDVATSGNEEESEQESEEEEEEDEEEEETDGEEQRSAHISEEDEVVSNSAADDENHSNSEDHESEYESEPDSESVEDNNGEPRLSAFTPKTPAFLSSSDANKASASSPFASSLASPFGAGHASPASQQKPLSTFDFAGAARGSVSDKHKSIAEPIPSSNISSSPFSVSTKAAVDAWGASAPATAKDQVGTSSSIKSEGQVQKMINAFNFTASDSPQPSFVFDSGKSQSDSAINTFTSFTNEKPVPETGLKDTDTRIKVSARSIEKEGQASTAKATSERGQIQSHASISLPTDSRPLESEHKEEELTQHQDAAEPAPKVVELSNYISLDRATPAESSEKGLTRELDIVHQELTNELVIISQNLSAMTEYIEASRSLPQSLDNARQAESQACSLLAKVETSQATRKAQLESLDFLKTSLVTLEIQKVKLQRLLRAQTDPAFAHSLRMSSLGPQHAAQQRALRLLLGNVEKDLTTFQSSLSVIKAKLAGQRDGSPPITAENISVAVAKIMRIATQKEREVEELQKQFVSYQLCSPDTSLGSSIGPGHRSRRSRTAQSIDLSMDMSNLSFGRASTRGPRPPHNHGASLLEARQAGERKRAMLAIYRETMGRTTPLKTLPS